MVNVIWVVEDLEDIRNGVEQTLHHYFPEAEVFVFKNGSEVLEIVDITPDVVILDLGLPDIDGILLLVTLKNRYKNVKILIFTIYDDSNHLFDALRLGADGYILKGDSNKSIYEIIQDLIQGGAPMSRSIARKIVNSFHHQEGSVSLLTHKENQILHFLTRGLMYKEIAEVLCLSVNTVKNHIKSIYTKLQVQNSREAMLKYIENKK